MNNCIVAWQREASTIVYLGKPHSSYKSSSRKNAPVFTRWRILLTNCIASSKDARFFAVCAGVIVISTHWSRSIPARRAHSGGSSAPRILRRVVVVCCSLVSISNFSTYLCLAYRLTAFHHCRVIVAATVRLEPKRWQQNKGISQNSPHYHHLIKYTQMRKGLKSIHNSKLSLSIHAGNRKGLLPFDKSPVSATLKWSEISASRRKRFSLFLMCAYTRLYYGD